MTQNERTTSLPTEWTEHGCGLIDAGDVGGDVQAGPAWSRRFYRWVPSVGHWAVIDAAFYLCVEERDGEMFRWVAMQLQSTTCTDIEDPGGTETGSDIEYDEDLCVFDWQATDDFARAQAEHWGTWAFSWDGVKA